MSWDNIAEVDCIESSSEQFMRAVIVWLKKPHVINRRLSGSKLIWSMHVPPSSEEITDIALRVRTLIKSSLPLSLCSVSDSICRALTVDGNQSSFCCDLETVRVAGFVATLRCLIPKQRHRFNKLLDLTLIDWQKKLSVCIPVCFLSSDETTVSPTVDKSYVFQYCDDQRVSLSCLSDGSEENVESCSYTSDWLANVLLVKLARWSQESHLSTEMSSLRLVDIESYTVTYERLKEKYGRHLMEIWCEKTDPQKFVYEDINIAAYLLVLWEQERVLKSLTTKQSFVDLGCGNGLLVYILTSEGHVGYGMDIRRRRIWDELSRVACLKETALVASDGTLYPETDWLIGNHSDELTPWIPLIAARWQLKAFEALRTYEDSCVASVDDNFSKPLFLPCSADCSESQQISSHYRCRYFVLPCCPWDFTKKFSDRRPDSSQYGSYLNYVRSIGEKCGFLVKEDRLRIPSTKRVKDELIVDTERQMFLQQRCSSDTSSRQTASDTTHGLSPNDAPIEFVPRAPLERPRNAVAIDNSSKERIRTTVLRAILSRATNLVTLRNDSSWNKGGSVSLRDVGEMFDKELLSQLKCECGGLQTVLKNCGDVFCVRNGSVSLRDWMSQDYHSYRLSRLKKKPYSAAQKLKTSACFYYCHHPDGCPLSANECRFAHGQEDLNS